MRRVPSGWFGDHIAEVREPVEVVRYGTVIGVYTPRPPRPEAPIVEPRDLGTQVIGEGAHNVPARSHGAANVHDVLSRVNRSKR